MKRWDLRSVFKLMNLLLQSDSLTLDRWNPKIIQLPRYPRLWGVMDSAFQRGPGELRKSQKQTAVLSAVGGTARELY